jgi:hypothetical protein
VDLDSSGRRLAQFEDLELATLKLQRSALHCLGLDCER